MTFKDWQLTLVTFQAWKMKFLNSMIFQVFHDQYKPCSETECSLLAEGSFPRYLAGGRKRDHLPHTTEKRPLFLLVPTWGGGGGYPYVRKQWTWPGSERCGEVWRRTPKVARCQGKSSKLKQFTLGLEEYY